MEKSGLRQAGEIVTLVGAIIETVGHAMLIIGTFFMWTIPAAIIIPLIWVARGNAKSKDSKGWMIYGIVQGVLCGWISLVGYILLLVDKIQRENKMPEQISKEVA
ncbi:MAG: hypothetical protein RR942_13615 [Romboutsia sp.]